MTKTEATNKFVTEYLASAKICCDKCFVLAINNQSWIAKAFSEGWDACSIAITGAPDSSPECPAAGNHSDSQRATTREE